MPFQGVKSSKLFPFILKNDCSYITCISRVLFGENIIPERYHFSWVVVDGFIRPVFQHSIQLYVKQWNIAMISVHNECKIFYQFNMKRIDIANNKSPTSDSIFLDLLINSIELMSDKFTFQLSFKENSTFNLTTSGLI